MHPSLLLGVELPPVPVVAGATARSEPAAVSLGTDGPRSAAALASWWSAARTAMSLGAGIVWFRGSIDGKYASCDACTIAAAAIDHVPGAQLGVVSSVPLERHPAMLAREVTALDVVSSGRAAVCLRWVSPDPSGGLRQAGEQFAEAVAVCGAVLREERPVFEGRHYHVAGAVNRPPPVQSGGLPVFADASAGGLTVVAADEGVGPSALHMMLRAASVVVCSDDAADVASWRGAIEETAVHTRGMPGVNEPPALVCKTTLDELAPPPGPGTSAGSGIGDRLRAARDAGADGVIVRIPASRHMGVVSADPWTTRSGAPMPSDPMPSDFEPALKARLAPWIR